MARLKFPQSIDDAPEASRPALKAVSQQLGITPNSFKLMSLSPSALSGVVALQGALSRTIDARTRDVVALAVSQANGCHYCLSARSHTAAQFNHATAEEIALARQGRSDDPRDRPREPSRDASSRNAARSPTPTSTRSETPAITTSRSSNSSPLAPNSCCPTS